MTSRLPDAAHLVALTVTLLAEAGGMAVLALLSKAGRARIRRHVAVASGANLVSHTAFWLGVPRLLPVGPGMLPMAEGMVVLLEATAYRLFCPFGWWRALSTSLLLNLVSLVLGVEIQR